MTHIIDAHCHIYPDAIAEKAVRSIGQFYDLQMGLSGTAEGLKAAHDAAGITRAVVHSVATTPKQVRSINDFIAKAVKESGGRFTGLGALHPMSADMRGDIEHLLTLGLHGVKLHPDFQRFCLDDPICDEMYALCRDAKLPMLIHTGDKRYDYSNPNRLLLVLKRFPGLTIVGAHFGGWSLWEDAARALCGQKDLYVDCSSSLYALKKETARELIRLYGADRVLFGSDYPMWSPGEELNRLRALDLSGDELEMILGGNAARVFSIV